MKRRCNSHSTQCTFPFQQMKTRVSSCAIAAFVIFFVVAVSAVSGDDPSNNSTTTVVPGIYYTDIIISV